MKLTTPLFILFFLLLIGCNKKLTDSESPLVLVNKTQLDKCIGEKKTIELSLETYKANAKTTSTSVTTINTTNYVQNVTYIQNVTYVYNTTLLANTSNSYTLGLIRQLKRYEKQLENATFYNESMRNKNLTFERNECLDKIRIIEDTLE